MDWISLSDAPFMGVLITTTLKATLILGAGVLAGLLFKKASASSRHFLMSALVITVSFMPFMTMIVPELTIPLPEIIKSHTAPEVSLSAALNAIPDARGMDRSVVPSSTTGIASNPASNRKLEILFYLWLVGSVVAAGRVAAGMAVCTKYRREARPLNSKRIIALVEKFSNRIGLRKIPAVMISSSTAVAYVNGITRPVLFLPSQVSRWPEDRLTSVLLHELAHIKRKDHISWPLINLAVSWLWFNPLVWVALGRIRRDKEKACDDYAISNGFNRNRYAKHLLEVYTFLTTSDRPAPVSLPFARKNQVKERIIYMLNQRIDRRPISRTMQLVFTVLLIIVAVPLISIKGLSSNIVLKDVTLQEREAVVGVMENFYSELSRGSDYQATRERFLTSDYFDDPDLTLENLGRIVRRPPFDNTLRLISEEGVAPAKEFSSRIITIERDGDELVVTQTVDITADRIRGKIMRDDEEGTITIVPDSDSKDGSGIEDCHLVKSLTQKIRFRQEGGEWKISKFNDGVAVMRMDTENPYGPIFLVWMEDIDDQTTPFGAGIFKVFPHDLIPDARNTKFTLEK